jgi:hypothetical protein
VNQKTFDFPAGCCRQERFQPDWTSRKVLKTLQPLFLPSNFITSLTPLRVILL